LSFVTTWISGAAKALAGAVSGGRVSLKDLIVKLVGSIPDLIAAGKAGPVENRKAWIDTGIDTADFGVGLGGLELLPESQFSPEVQEWLTDRLLQIAHVALYLTSNIPLQGLPQSFYDRGYVLAPGRPDVSAAVVADPPALQLEAPKSDPPTVAGALIGLIASSSPLLKPAGYEFKSIDKRFDDLAAAVVYLLGQDRRSHAGR
jgi:hypothetical protein